jgi:septal ring factor EnvC (AmiA/AmiB activator)
MLAVMVASRLDVLVVVALLLMFLVQAYTVSLFVRFQGDTRTSLTEVRQGLGEVRQGLGEVRQGLGEVRQGLGEVRQGLTAVTTELRGLAREQREHDSEIAALAREVFGRRPDTGEGEPPRG